MRVVRHHEQHHPKQDTLHLVVGNNLRGMRISEVTFENWEELVQLIKHPEYLTQIKNAMLTIDQQLARGIIK